jgi:phospho-acceptor domain-containing protein
MRPRSRIITPLIARGSVIGCVTLMRTGLSNENDTSADLAFAQQLADRAALAVDNARLFRDTQQALHVRQDVLRFVSHDLKNPLTSLRMPTEILHELIQEGAKHDSPAEIKERIVYGLKHMDTLTLSMWGLVNELLDVSQMQSGQQLPLKRSEVDLVALVGASIAEYQSPDRSIGLRTSEPVLVGRGTRHASAGFWTICSRTRSSTAPAVDRFRSALSGRALETWSGCWSKTTAWASLRPTYHACSTCFSDQATFLPACAAPGSDWRERQIVEQHGGLIDSSGTFHRAQPVHNDRVRQKPPRRVGLAPAGKRYGLLGDGSR